MPRTQLKPIRMPELFAFNAPETAQKLPGTKRKFVPQRITIADLQEFSPIAKARKVQESTKASKVRESAKANSTTRKRFTAKRMTVTPADLEDTPPLPKSKGKLQKYSTKTARKVLFGNEHKRTSRSSFQATAVTKFLESKKLMQSKRLDTTNPLIDINELEADFLNDAHVGFKKPFRLPIKRMTKFKSSPLSDALPKEEHLVSTTSTTATSKSPQSIPSIEITEEAPVASPASNNPSVNLLDVSVTDSEFVEMETKMGIAGKSAKTSTDSSSSLLSLIASSPQVRQNLKLGTPNHFPSHSFKEIEDILQEQENDLRNLKQNFEDFEGKCLQNKRRIGSILQALKKEKIPNGFTTTSSLRKANQSLSPLMPRLENLRVSTLKKSTKKNVTFKLKYSPQDGVLTRARSSSEDEAACSLNSLLGDATLNQINGVEDKGLKRAVSFYNSMRKDYTSILSTPKFDRSSLQSPTSARSIRRGNSVSRKIQKQCLLLHDTPMK